ncbi:cytoplasmic protein NCK2-like protein [Dinothrombium tinctorium]|uniref:Cytoplasmic protein NCK2-like protein n=1 Tax=Dinothrombium tinctorium TaxID=1965070 RepID=A0A3S4R4W4_9ACAR|nr:cytoplasmic protein NCK2-like protein [Dinothrombium tinctorium]RWS11011.1 cytoplasmic protein NCK2-like protein [Dinothrombium tinctorium]RWS11645.1 cytoplasmic protein NCK2-like protein [Dinothrombium tinctorium]
MAFLCPVRIRRGKKKKGEQFYLLSNFFKAMLLPENEKIGSRTPSIGRITGSASIETLVRVGIEKEHGLSPDSKMVVLHEFTPCVDDELEVKRGQIVNVLYQENDWVYVIAENNQEGFIPHSYCAPIGSHLAEMALNVKHKKLPRNSPDADRVETSGLSQLDAESFSVKPSKDVHPFFKDPSGRYVVLYTFIARDENDVSVERGEYVTVLNKDDPDWYWIVRTDGQEGFVPSAFVCPIDMAQGQNSQQTVKISSNHNNVSNENSTEVASAQAVNSESEARFHGTELVMLYDYKAQAPDDLSVRRGDWVYANLNNQTVDGWLWAYAPKSRKYGFIPKAYARPPAMTSL